jgi:acyl-CoA ligase (AMP-forming) (exosortase A-associated)
MQRTINSFLKKSVSKWPNKVAVIKGEHKFSYADIDNLSGLLADSLAENGIKKDDRIGIYLPKSPEEVISIFGIVKAGGIFVILNPKLKKDQTLHIINDCQIKGIITNDISYNSMLKNELENTCIRFLLLFETAGYKSIKIKSRKSITSNLASRKIGCIIYTSGSTGRPKGVVITHKNLIDGADIINQYLHCKHSDKVLSLLPFSFDYGLNQLLTTFRNGATIVLQDYVFPQDVLKTIEKEKITALAGIPTIWINLLNFTRIQKYNLSSLRYITNSGGKIPVEYVKKMIKVFKGTKIYLMYGLTEAFRSTYLNPSLVSKKPSSIGKAIPRVKISVLNKEGKECKPGEEGELVHRGALVSLGYWGNKAATDERIKKLPEQLKDKKKNEYGVFSGDLVKRDKDGYLYFIGRKDELIKSSGYRISPTEIEEVLYKIPGLIEAVVFGKEDLKLGEKIVAVISFKIGSGIEREKIISFCSQHLPDYAVPHEIIFLNDMPKTSSGKLDRSLIKAKYDEYKKYQ